MSESDSNELMFIAAAILLSQEPREASGDFTQTQIERAVTNAEKLREEIRKRREDRAQTQQAGVVQSFSDQVIDDQFPPPGPLMP